LVKKVYMYAVQKTFDWAGCLYFLGKKEHQLFYYN